MIKGGQSEQEQRNKNNQDSNGIVSFERALNNMVITIKHVQEAFKRNHQ